MIFILRCNKIFDRFRSFTTSGTNIWIKYFFMNPVRESVSCANRKTLMNAEKEKCVYLKKRCSQLK